MAGKKYKIVWLLLLCLCGISRAQDLDSIPATYVDSNLIPLKVRQELLRVLPIPRYYPHWSIQKDYTDQDLIYCARFIYGVDGFLGRNEILYYIDSAGTRYHTYAANIFVLPSRVKQKVVELYPNAKDILWDLDYNPDEFETTAYYARFQDSTGLYCAEFDSTGKYLGRTIGYGANVKPLPDKIVNYAKLHKMGYKIVGSMRCFDSVNQLMFIRVEKRRDLGWCDKYVYYYFNMKGEMVKSKEGINSHVMSDPSF